MFFIRSEHLSITQEVGTNSRDILGTKARAYLTNIDQFILLVAVVFPSPLTFIADQFDNTKAVVESRKFL